MVQNVKSPQNMKTPQKRANTQNLRKWRNLAMFTIERVNCANSAKREKAAKHDVS
jgi:hypothetical protein